MIVLSVAKHIHFDYALSNWRNHRKLTGVTMTQIWARILSLCTRMPTLLGGYKIPCINVVHPVLNSSLKNWVFSMFSMYQYSEKRPQVSLEKVWVRSAYIGGTAKYFLRRTRISFNQCTLDLRTGSYLETGPETMFFHYGSWHLPCAHQFLIVLFLLLLHRSIKTLINFWSILPLEYPWSIEHHRSPTF